MSSCESDRSDSRHQTGWSSPGCSFTDSMPSSGGHDYSTGGSSQSTGSAANHVTSASYDNCYSLHSILPEMTQLPWTEGDILSVLQQGKFKDCCGNITIECIQRLTYLLQRPLVRIAREVERFSELCHKCSKHDVVSASKIILSSQLFRESNKFASQCAWLYSMSHTNSNSSKSSLCSLTLSVGKHQRWLMEALPATYIHELAAVYLAATMESIIEQTACLALMHDNSSWSQLREKTVITTEMLEAGIRRITDLNRLYHPYTHLLSTVGSSSEFGKATSSKQNTMSDKANERNLMMKCASSIAELRDIVSQAMNHRYSGTKSVKVRWSTSAVETLYYFMKCSKPDCLHSNSPRISLRAERWNVPMSPIAEWMRLALAFTEHRRENVIESDDVMQAARLLIPGVDCPARGFRHFESASVSEFTLRSSNDTRKKLGLMLLSSGVGDLKKTASSFISKADIDYTNTEGMTSLMCAGAKGDDSSILTLLKSGASTEISMAAGHPSYPGWTALCFAVSNGHHDVAKLLLEYGCRVEGSAAGVGNTSETPLQLACATGQLGMVRTLTQHHANPHQHTNLLPGLEVKHTINSYTLAASHGRTDVIRWLFSKAIKVKGSGLLTLTEMLTESCDGTVDGTSLEKSSNQRIQDEEENEYMVIENDYVTIEEVRQHDRNRIHLTNILSPSHLHSFESAMLQAAESGFLDLTLEIRSTGFTWTMHIWYMSLNTAHLTQRKAIVQSLLMDFTSIDYTSNWLQLSHCCLPLMFDIFRASKNEMISQQLAVIFSLLYGSQPMPLLKDMRVHSLPFIQSSYVNSRELADVSFIVEQKTFYAHKVILASASMRFKSMLSAFVDVAMPEIEVRDIGYETFEKVIRYVYEGTCITKITSLADFKLVKRLLAAAHYFQLDGMKRKCEILLSKNLSVDNCLSVYKTAKMHSCLDLMEFCEAYFLQNFSRMLRKCEEFKRILYSSKVHNRELMNRLSDALAARLSSKMLNLSSTDNVNVVSVDL